MKTFLNLLDCTVHSSWPQPNIEREEVMNTSVAAYSTHLHKGLKSQYLIL